MEDITFEKLPAVIGRLYEKIENIEMFLKSQALDKPKESRFVDIHGASQITHKSANALRVQISLGNLFSIKKGNRHYFERDYLEQWIIGDKNINYHGRD